MLGRGGLLRVYVPSSNGLKDATLIPTSKNENRQAETLTDKHLHVCKCVNMFVYTFKHKYTHICLFIHFIIIYLYAYISCFFFHYRKGSVV